jgi:hypothetical protein
VEVRLSTHDCGGLSKYDIDMAQVSANLPFHDVPHMFECTLKEN